MGSVRSLTIAMFALVGLLTSVVDAQTCNVNITSVSTSQYGLTVQEMQQVLNLMNNARQEVSNAKSMVLLKWDSALAKVAYTYATKSQQGQTPTISTAGTGFDYIGQITQPSATNRNAYSIVYNWKDDGRYFVYQACPSDTQSMTTYCGRCTLTSSRCHPYVSMIWAQTTSVGCGYISKGSSAAAYLTCAFGPGGLRRGEEPYVIGTKPAGCQLPPTAPAGDGDGDKRPLWHYFAIAGGILVAIFGGGMYFWDDGGCCDGGDDDKKKKKNGGENGEGMLTDFQSMNAAI